MQKKWTEEEKEFVRQNAGKLTDVQAAQKLSEIVGRDVSVHALRRVRQMLGLKKKRGRGKCELDG